MDCSELDPDTHDLLQRITRSRWNPKTMVIKTGVSTLSDKTGLRYADVQLLLEDLAVDGFIHFDKEFGRITRLIPCGCEESLDAMFSSEPLGSAAYDDGPTRGNEGRGVGGGRQDSPSTEGAKERTRGHARVHEADPTPPARKRVVKKKPRRGIDWFVANPSELKPTHLAKYFDERMGEVRTTRAGFRSVGQVNHGALVGTFARWIREDEISPIQIVAMIDIFARNPKFLKEGVPAWKVFLGKRELLVRQAANLASPVTDPGWDDGDVLDHDPSDDLGWT